MRVTALALLALAAASCAADDAPEPLLHQFRTRPVSLVASSELPAECVESLLYAIDWYREKRATLVMWSADPLTPVLNGTVVSGQVGVVPGRLSDNVRGETQVALTVGGDINGALVTLAFCDERTVVHELAHALGLPHRGTPGNLMYPAIAGGGWTLDADQLAWIADPYGELLSE